MSRLSPATLARFPLVLLLFLSVPGCAGMGWEELADVLAGGVLGGQDVSGEIRRVDTRRQEIELQSAWGGAERIQYDGRTEVIYGQRRYRVENLERGDLVRVTLAAEQSRTPYARLIRVQESASDRGRDDDRYRQRQRFEGAIVAIDTRAGWFELEQSRGRVVLVTLPYSPPRDVLNRFRGLRRGQYVRIEGILVSGSRAELVRFL